MSFAIMVKVHLNYLSQTTQTFFVREIDRLMLLR